MPTTPFTRTTVAGEDDAHYYTKTLYELTNHVGILPPTFTGTLLSNEYGLEEWNIKTFIPGSGDDPSDADMEYSDDYPDWDYSIDVAMQGAIARICHKYHDQILRTSAYRQFGERTADGEAVYRSETETMTLTHRYHAEREFSAAGMEHLMRVQLRGIDKLKDVVLAKNEVIVKAQDLAQSLEAERVALVECISLLEDPLKMEEKLICSNIWSELIQKTLVLTLENRTAEAKKTEALKKELETLKLENAKLKETVSKLTSSEESSDEHNPVPGKHMRASEYCQLFETAPRV